ncbi:MAG: hypothetical protein H0X36_12915 [Sphingomonadaceae bacterium]|nr:hypothetical protein [Sphingomonadaceae bacterium]
MIAQRFRSLGWVAGVATAATGLYLVSLQVAAERGKLEAVERQIASAQRDMRQLQTELGTRASMRQLERWNGDVLALSAPKAGQYLKGDAQLASLDVAHLNDAPNAPPAVMMAAAPAEQPQPLAPAAMQAPVLQHATYEKPAAAPRIERVALLDPAVIQAAAVESRKRP